MSYISEFIKHYGDSAAISLLTKDTMPIAALRVVCEKIWAEGRVLDSNLGSYVPWKGAVIIDAGNCGEHYEIVRNESGASVMWYAPSARYGSESHNGLRQGGWLQQRTLAELAGPMCLYAIEQRNLQTWQSEIMGLVGARNGLLVFRDGSSLKSAYPHDFHTYGYEPAELDCLVNRAK
jgi:hypothetical protein